MKTFWSIVLLIALVIWYSIGGWSAVFKAVLAMGGFGLCIAGALKMRHDRKQHAVVAIPTGTLPPAGYGLISASTDMWLMVADIEAGRYQFSEEE